MLLAEVVALLGRKEYQARELAFDWLYKYYQQPILRYLVMRVHDQEYAADLCQVTFTRVWTYFKRLETSLPRTAKHLRNWLYKIASDVAIDEYRSKKHIDYQPLPDSEEYAQLAELRIEGVEDRIHDLIWLQDEVPQMPQRYRECFVRKHYWGYSQKEIAAELGISESAVSAYVSLGKSQLHKKYFTVTLDLPRAEAIHAEDEFLNILRGGEGLSDNEILDEYQVKAINWRYKEYMRKHTNDNDPQRVEAIHAHDAILNLLEGGEGFFDAEKLDEYQVKALDWRYREYMRKHANELRSDLFLDDEGFGGNGIKGYFYRLKPKDTKKLVNPFTE